MKGQVKFESGCNPIKNGRKFADFQNLGLRKMSKIDIW